MNGNKKQPISISYILFFVSLLNSFFLPCQDIEEKKIKHIIFAEVGSIGGYGSVNYENIIHQQKKVAVSFRAGLSTYHILDYTNQFNPDIIIPLSVNFINGVHHQFLLGIGQTFSSTVVVSSADWKPTRSNQFHTNLTVGYRHIGEKGFLVGIYYTPIIEFQTLFRHWAGIALGYGF
jgi:hypothetical protein